MIRKLWRCFERLLSVRVLEISWLRGADGAARIIGMMAYTRGGDDLTSTHTINDTYSFPDWVKELGWTNGTICVMDY